MHRYIYNADGVLTWIVRGSDSEFKIECHNASEIIDGFYRAEYFRDTSKILDSYSELHAGIRCVEPEHEPEPRVIVSQQSILETVRRMQLQKKLQDDMKKEEEAYYAALQASCDTASVSENTDSITLQKSAKKHKAMTPKRRKRHEKTNHSIANPSQCVRVMNNTREICEDAIKEVLNESNVGWMDAEETHSPTKYSFISQKADETFCSDIIKRELMPMRPGNIGERGRKQQKVDNQTDLTSDTEQGQSQEETSRRHAEDIDGVRRGKRIRKNSTFQDFYLPISDNEWIAETYVNVPKITY